MSNWRMGLMGPIGLMGKRPAMKTSPTGQLAVRLVPQSGDPYSPLVFKTSPAQLYSKISNLAVSCGEIRVPALRKRVKNDTL
ncbi:MAG: hypothetical protein ACYC4Q_06795 [Victivallaceae bacterium]